MAIEQQGNPYAQGLEKCAANYMPLTPLSFLERSAYIYPDRLAVIHGQRRYTWKEVDARARRLASALKARGVGPGDTVATVLNNTPEMYEAHFGVRITSYNVCYTKLLRAVMALLQFALERGAQVGDLFLVHEQVGIARDPELVAAEHRP